MVPHQRRRLKTNGRSRRSGVFPFHCRRSAYPVPLRAWDPIAISGESPAQAYRSGAAGFTPPGMDGTVAEPWVDSRFRGLRESYGPAMRRTVSPLRGRRGPKTPSASDRVANRKVSVHGVATLRGGTSELFIAGRAPLHQLFTRNAPSSEPLDSWCGTCPALKQPRRGVNRYRERASTAMAKPNRKIKKANHGKRPSCSKARRAKRREVRT